ncbi:MAG TPA: hypothetical protein ENK91_00805 [Bacteroidetes bacterium]|nr:hypothetical protein [Bacteroidota bacterium]
MKRFLLIFALCTTVFSAKTQQIYNKPVETNFTTLKQDIDSLQSLFSPIFAKLEKNKRKTNDITEYFENLKYGYFNYAKKLLNNRKIEEEIKKYNFDIDYYTKISKNISLLLKNVEFFGTKNTDPEKLKARCNLYKSKKCNKSIRKFNIKSGEKLFILDNQIFIKNLIHKYKDLYVFNAFLDTFDLRWNYIDYNLDKCLTDIIKKNNQKMVFLDMTHKSEALKDIKFDKIIISNIFVYKGPQTFSDLESILPYTSKKTIIYFDKIYEYKENGKKKESKINREEFEKMIAKNGFEIIKIKKFNKKTSFFNGHELKNPIKLKGIFYSIRLKPEFD